MQANYDRLWIETRSAKSSRKIERRPSVNVRALISIITIMMISNHKIKAKSRILIEALDKNYMTLMTHITHVIFSNSDEIKVDQKIIFLSKNMIIAEKIIFVLDVTIQIIQLKPANTCLTQIRHL